MNIDNNTLSFKAPELERVRVDNRSNWYVDILTDQTSGRGVCELCDLEAEWLPELLNAPHADSARVSIIAPNGVGLDSINMTADASSEFLRLRLPTPEEIFTTLLWSNKYEPVTDEKRTIYEPIFTKLNGPLSTGDFFAGPHGFALRQILEHKSQQDIIKHSDVCKIKTAFSKLDSKQLDGFDGMIGPFRNHFTDLQIKIGRFRSATRNRATANSAEFDEVIETLISLNFIERRLESMPCRRCNKVTYLDKMPVDTNALCYFCNNRLAFGYRARFALKPTPLILPIQEGIVPVALTARFLFNLTSTSFIWSPGLKYRSNDARGDIDIAAFCDGYLVFAECKDFSHSQSVESSLLSTKDQFSELIKTAIDLNARLVVLSSLVSHYPPGFEDHVASLCNDKIQYLLLTKEDLQDGFRLDSSEGHTQLMKITDVVSSRFGTSSFFEFTDKHKYFIDFGFMRYFKPGQ